MAEFRHVNWRSLANAAGCNLPSDPFMLAHQSANDMEQALGRCSFERAKAKMQLAKDFMYEIDLESAAPAAAGDDACVLALVFMNNTAWLMQVCRGFRGCSRRA